MLASTVVINEYTAVRTGSDSRNHRNRSNGFSSTSSENHLPVLPRVASLIATLVCIRKVYPIFGTVPAEINCVLVVDTDLASYSVDSLLVLANSTLTFGAVLKIHKGPCIQLCKFHLEVLHFLLSHDTYLFAKTEGPFNKAESTIWLFTRAPDNILFGLDLALQE